MISNIQGTVLYKNSKSLVIQAAGLGYRIYATPLTLALFKKGEEALLWTHLAVRENSMDLYGFNTLEELHFFELLISISGIGPKGALGVLSVANVETLRQAIGTDDISYLTKVSGIGKKSAEKIVLELRDKIDVLENTEDTTTLREESEALEALMSLGYKQNDVRDILKKVSSEAKTTGEKIREALKILGS